MAVTFAPLTMADYDEAVALWRRTEGVGLSDADLPQNLAAYLDRNPGFSFAARDGGRLVGAVCGGHDGRRGYLGHLAVEPSHRGRGVARGLVDRCLTALRAAGIQKCHAVVFATNQAGRAFWQHMGWTPRTDLVMVSRDLGPD